MQVNFETGEDVVFSGVKTRLMGSPPTGNLHKTNVREREKRKEKEKSPVVFICQKAEFLQVIRLYFAYVEREKIMRGGG